MTSFLWVQIPFHLQESNLITTVPITSWFNERNWFPYVDPGGGDWPRKGVWGCAALKTPFSRLSPSLQGSHFKQKSQFTRPPFENFCPNLSSQASKFGNLQLTSPQIWKFSVHKPPDLEISSSQAPSFRGKYQFASPTLRKSGPHTPTWKKVECPRMWMLQESLWESILWFSLNLQPCFHVKSWKKKRKNAILWGMST